MYTYNDEYDNEIIKIIRENPKAYGKMLKSKGFLGRYPDRSYLYDYIMESTKILNEQDFVYSLKTRVFWTVNKINSWDDPLVCCKICGRPIKKWNIVNFTIGYKNTCCDECERKAASITNKDTCMRRYGVTNVFASKDVKNIISSKSEQIRRKCESTKLKRFGSKTFNNAKRAKQTKIERYGNVWHLEKCKETMIERYGASNPMQVASIQKRQQQAVYTMDGIKFDSSWEVYMYIWLRDNNIPFQYHPDTPQFWYQKKDGTKHRYYPDFILTEKGEIWEPKGDNSFTEDHLPIKNGWFDWTEKYEYMLKLGVRFFFKEDIEPYRLYVEEKYGKDFIINLRNTDIL